MTELDTDPDAAVGYPSSIAIAWLRTPEGEQWSEQRLSDAADMAGEPFVTLARHEADDGVFATVMDEGDFAGSAARWPVPFPCYDLDITSDADRELAMAREAFEEILKPWE